MSPEFELLKEQLIRDYFTPGIKAEVTFDTLLTPYIEGIVAKGLGLEEESLKLIAKELSVDEEENSKGNMGNKADYVLADRETVYLVELKTTEGSISEKQQEVYEKAENMGGTFGNVFGKRLIKILSKKGTGFNIKGLSEEESGISIGIQTDEGQQWIDEDKWCDDTLQDLWREIYRKRGSFRPQIDMNISEDAKKSEIAMAMIRSNGWPWRGHASRKYLFLLGMIIDYLDAAEGNRLWDKPIELVYLVPRKSRKQSAEAIHVIELLEDATNKERYLYKQSQNDGLAECIKEAFLEIFEKSEWRRDNL